MDDSGDSKPPWYEQQCYYLYQVGADVSGHFGTDGAEVSRHIGTSADVS